MAPRGVGGILRRIRRRVQDPPPAAAFGRPNSPAAYRDQTVLGSLTAARRRQDFAPPLPPALEEEFVWEAFKVFHDDGTVMRIENVAFIRSLDELASGRLVAVWPGQEPAASFFYNLQFSDDGGKTWSALQSKNISTSNPAMSRSLPRFGGIVAWGGRVLVFARRLSGENQTIRRLHWDPGTGWGGDPVVWLAGAAGENRTRIRPARSRDRNVGGVVCLETNVSGAVEYIPFANDSGDAGAVETVGVPPLGADDIALLFDGTDPKVVVLDTVSNKIQKKTRTGGSWPGAWTEVTIDDPPTDPDILAVVGGDGIVFTPKWGGGAFLSNGDAHGLLKVNGDQNRDFRHRRREGGTWDQETVDFGALDDPMSGDGSEWYGGMHSMGMWASGAKHVYALAWMTETSFVRPYTLWWLRRRVAAA